MTIINATTKRGQNLIAGATCVAGRTLHDVYGKFSKAKAQAYETCLRMCREEDGNNFRIISANSYGFSVAWDTTDGLRIETPQNSYFITKKN